MKTPEKRKNTDALFSGLSIEDTNKLSKIWMGTINRERIIYLEIVDAIQRSYTGHSLKLELTKAKKEYEKKTKVSQNFLNALQKFTKTKRS